MDRAPQVESRGPSLSCRVTRGPSGCSGGRCEIVGNCPDKKPGPRTQTPSATTSGHKRLWGKRPRDGRAKRTVERPPDLFGGV